MPAGNPLGYHDYKRAPERTLAEIIAEATAARRPEAMPQEMWNDYKRKYDTIPRTIMVNGKEVPLKSASTNEYMRRLAQEVEIRGLAEAIAEAALISDLEETRPHRYASHMTHAIAANTGRRMYRLLNSANPERRIAKLSRKKPRESLEHFYIRTGQR